jgi:hypothetical protein
MNRKDPQNEILDQIWRTYRFYFDLYKEIPELRHEIRSYRI